MNKNLNIVGELSRSCTDLSKYEKTADYAELSHNDKIQMFYRYNKDFGWWEYLSFANLWMGSSDDITKKRLLKLVD